MVGRTAGRDEHEALDLTAQEVRDELALARGVAARVPEDDTTSGRGDGLLDAEREVAVVRIAEVRDRDPDEPARLPGPEAPGVLVPAVAELADRLEHALLDLGTHVGAAGEGSGDRHRAHARAQRDLLDGRLLAGVGDTDHGRPPLASSPDYGNPSRGSRRAPCDEGLCRRIVSLLRSRA